MKQIILIALVFISLPGIMLAQDDDLWQNKERKEKMEAIKIAYITNELNLTPEESQQFWPIYNEFQQKLQNLRKEGRPSKNPDEMTDAEADKQIEKHLQMEKEKLELLRITIDKLKPVIGSKRVMKVNSAEEDFREKLLRRAGKNYEKNQRKKKTKRELFRDGQ